MQTALVVEDDPSIRRLMVQLLQEEGFDHVLEATNVSSALALAQEHPLDVVVLDYVLPGQTGIDVAEQLRAQAGFNGPLLVTTALPRAQAEEACAELDACECLPKPFDITEFLAAVRGCLTDAQRSLAV